MQSEFWQRKCSTLIGEIVCVKLSDCSRIEGALYAIDPSNNSLILFQKTPSQTGADVKVVMGHAITDIRLVEQEDNQQCLLKIDEIKKTASEKTESQPVLDQKKQKICEILTQNRIEFEIDETSQKLILFHGIAKLSPPYDNLSWECTNETILKRLVSLMGTIEYE